MNQYLIFDLGTSYFKACLFDEMGTLLAVRRTPTPIDYFDDGKAELSPDSLCRVLLEATSQLRVERGSLNDVAAISFASQANTFTLLDKHDRALIPLLVWNDSRARGDASPLQEFAHSDDFYNTTGIANIDFQFTPAKLHWLARHEPSILSRTCKIASISDYLTLWMTGNLVTESSVAWLTGLVDTHEAAWWEDACRVQSVPREWLPEIVRTGFDLGPLLPNVAAELGVSRDCRFIVGCLDQFAGAIGAGNVVPGNVSETTGTVLAMVRRSESFRLERNAGVFQGPAPTPGEYYQMIFGGPSAMLLEAYRNSLPHRPSFEQLDAWAAYAASSHGLELDLKAAAQGAECTFLNRRIEHTVGNEVYAILEAVADNLAAQLAMLCADEMPTFVRSAGGASRSALWQKIKSEKLGRPALATECAEPTSLGAAMLAHQSLCGSTLEQISRGWATTRGARS